MDKLLIELQEKYGVAEGLRLFNTVLPGIMSDFNRMLKNAGVGRVISEEYRLDDGSGAIVVKGFRQADGEIKTEANIA